MDTAGHHHLVTGSVCRALGHSRLHYVTTRVYCAASAAAWMDVGGSDMARRVREWRWDVHSCLAACLLAVLLAG